MRKSASKSHRKLRSSSRVSEDRISDLPDCVIQHIISFLDAKDAVKTCVLAKRWESLWTSTPNLLFYCEPRWRDEEEVDRFASFVGKTLAKHSSPKLDKFLLECNCRYISEDEFESWLRFAANRGPEELCLQLRFSCDEKLQQKWLGASDTNSSVRKWWFAELLEGCFGRTMKVLSLSQVIFRNDKMRSILLGSPLLERLILRKCELYEVDPNSRFVDHFNNFGIIDASHTMLKELVIDTPRSQYDDQKVKISVPNLLSLTISGYNGRIFFELANILSLVEANVDLKCHEEEKGMLKDLLRNLGHVKKFSVGMRCITEDGRLKKAIIARFATATRRILEVDMDSANRCFPELSYLLCNLHHLEKLTINLMHPDCLEFQSYDVDLDPHGDYVAPVEPFPMWYLENIKMTGFAAGTCASSDKLLVEMVKHLLANAKVLKKLIICAGEDNATSVKPRSFKKLFKISQKLLSFKRASPHAVILFESHPQ